MAPVDSWVVRVINSAATLPHGATTMTTAVEALGAEFGTPRKAANKAGAMAQDLLVHAARRVRTARWVTLLQRVNKTQEEASIAEGVDKGEDHPDTREEVLRQAKSGTRDAPYTGGAQGCLAAERQRLTLMLNGNEEDESPPTE